MNFGLPSIMLGRKKHTSAKRAPRKGKRSLKRLLLPAIAATREGTAASTGSVKRTPRPSLLQSVPHRPPAQRPPLPAPRRSNTQRIDSSTTKGRRITWQKGPLLGSGSEGQVFSALNVATGSVFAVKQLFRSELAKDLASVIHQEVTLLAQLRHPHIVTYLGSEVVDSRLCLYLEHLSGGSIRDLLVRIGALPESLCRRYTRQMLEGLAYLHQNQVLHRDIKGANLLLDQSGLLKLSDFGNSRQYTEKGESGMLTTLRGSLAWTAPEVVLQIGYGRKSDIWSVGCTVLEMLSGQAPWKGVDDYIAVLVKLAKTQELPHVPSHCSPEAQHFLSLCLQRDSTQRPTAAQLLQHPFCVCE